MTFMSVGASRPHQKTRVFLSNPLSETREKLSGIFEWFKSAAARGGVLRVGRLRLRSWFVLVGCGEEHFFGVLADLKGAAR